MTSHFSSFSLFPLLSLSLSRARTGTLFFHSSRAARTRGAKRGSCTGEVSVGELRGSDISSPRAKYSSLLENPEEIGHAGPRGRSRERERERERESLYKVKENFPLSFLFPLFSFFHRWRERNITENGTARETGHGERSQKRSR